MKLDKDTFLLDDYNYELPAELIAQRPLQNRDESRLLVLDRRSGTIAHRRFLDLPSLLDSNDRLVLNNTKVVRSRLIGNRISRNAHGVERGGEIEFLVLKKVAPLRYEGIMRSSAPQKVGLEFQISQAQAPTVTGKLVQGSADGLHGTVIADFDRDPIELEVGQIPLPPYIERSEEKEDESRYQTVYAQNPGSSAAPTAGLHFTNRVFQALRDQGVSQSQVTLHVGLATFRPIKTSDIRNHEMHSEIYEIENEVASKLTQWKAAGKRIVAVGTTSLRTLESCWNPRDREFVGGVGETSLYVYPGGRAIQSVDRLITNFHLPKSTLLLLVSAFAGRELILEAYQEAIREKYRFFSYGDAMLIL